MKNQLSQSPLHLSALALLPLIAISLIGCSEATQSEVDSQEPAITYDPPNSEPSSSPSPQAPMPFPDFYGTGPGDKFYGN